MKKHIIFLFIIFCSNQVFGMSLWSADSIGISTNNDKQYIIHEVEAGETLFGLSQRYGVGVEAIKNENAQSVSSLKIGQKVLIPFHQKVLAKGDKIHTVKSSETLFSISRQYNVKVDDLKMWNNLSGNSISIGQKLVIKGAVSNTSNSAKNNEIPKENGKSHTVVQSQTLYSISRMYGVSTDQIKEWNHLEYNTLEIGQVLVVSSSRSQLEKEEVSNSSMLPIGEKEAVAVIPLVTTPKQVEMNETETAEVKSDSDDEVIDKPVEKIVQRGLAEVIENTEETKKYLALHREAPAGTIMQVQNDMNGQSVFVRVVGGIPSTGDNSKVILKISQKAFDRLGAVDTRFPVEISYIP
jgi:LysM repeat protein